MGEQVALIEGHAVGLTHLEKQFWPEGLTKAHLVKYYADVAPYLLPHLRNRPVVMKRYPDGIFGGEFYQKETPAYAPAWLKTHPVRHSGKVVHYIVGNDTATLVWLANQGCIEVHAWLARIDNLACPDIAVMDLDPAEGATFADVLEIALLVRKALDEFKLKSFPKTSGAGGLHLFTPLKPVYPWVTVTGAMKYIAKLVEGVVPDRATTERKVGNRTGRVYLDYLQNGRGKTMAFQYSLRPLPGAPVSTPLEWGEVEEGRIRPGDFNIDSIFPRLKAKGDVYADLFTMRQSLDDLIRLL